MDCSEILGFLWSGNNEITVSLSECEGSSEAVQLQHRTLSRKFIILVSALHEKREVIFQAAEQHKTLVECLPECMQQLTVTVQTNDLIVRISSTHLG